MNYKLSPTPRLAALMCFVCVMHSMTHKKIAFRNERRERLFFFLFGNHIDRSTNRRACHVYARPKNEIARARRNVCSQNLKCMLNIPGRSIAFWLINNAQTQTMMAATAAACDDRHRNNECQLTYKLSAHATDRKVNDCYRASVRRLFNSCIACNSFREYFLVWSIFNLGCETKSVIIWWIFCESRAICARTRYEQVLCSGLSSSFSLLLLLSRFVWDVRWRQCRRSSGGGVAVGICIWSFIWSNMCRRAYLEFKNNDQNKWKLRVFIFILMCALLGRSKEKTPTTSSLREVCVPCLFHSSTS